MNYNNEKLIANLVFGTSTKAKLQNMNFDENFINDLKTYVEMMSNNHYLNKRMQNNIYLIIEKLRETNKDNFFWMERDNLKVACSLRKPDTKFCLFYSALLTSMRKKTKPVRYDNKV